MSRFAQKPVATSQSPMVDTYQFGFSDSIDRYKYVAKPGLNEAVVRTISEQKNEPKWMLAYRLAALEKFNSMQLPKWGGELGGIDFNQFHYYLRP
ncbi:MAG TPA: Fe-S cluster assembly protein SufB, partial [Candidatus Woesebacteria bacterium]|nr:Fe-S cluster assembly protein SufB [Candidatus Woesebacteria bacterium]